MPRQPIQQHAEDKDEDEGKVKEDEDEETAAAWRDSNKNARQWMVVDARRSDLMRAGKNNVVLILE